MVERIEFSEQLLAVVVRHTFSTPGVSFFTSDDLPQQLAYFRHPTGHTIQAHVHTPVSRQIVGTMETLFIQRGQLKINFYTSDEKYVESKVVGAGDVVLLVAGGHGFEVLDEVGFFVVKQGPYVHEQDKTRFTGIETTATKTSV